jgi:subtilisin family serine protease
MAALALAVCGLTALSIAAPIHLQVGSFDPQQRMLPLPEALTLRSTDAPGFHIVQFKGGITRADRAFLQQHNLEPVQYLPENAYVLRIDGSQKRMLESWQRVGWVGTFHPGYKISPELGKRPLYTPQRILEAARGIHQMAITLFDGEDPTEVMNLAQRAGLELLEATQAGPRWHVLVRGRTDAAAELARVDSVAFIEQGVDNQHRNDRTAWVIQSNVLNSMPIWDRGLRGEGMIVGVLDSAVWISHNMFRDPAHASANANHRKIIFQASTGAGSHGTHVAGTIAGDSSPFTGSTWRNGIAYRARMTTGPIPGSTALYSALNQAYGFGARIHTNSWGNDGTTAYTTHSQQIDQFSWDREDAIVGFAVTNTSNLRTPENAKSVLAVGNTNHTPNQHTPNTGGTGPTIDGRRKPEIWAPGTGIMSASSTNSAGWSSSTGTSMACPAIMGAAALVRQYYTEGWDIHGSPTRNRRRNPSGALIRATLMNGGVDMTGIAGYPGPREGWGRLLLDNVLSFTGQTRKLMVNDRWNVNGLQPGEHEDFMVRVTDASEVLKITMTFTDWPAAVNASFAPVNNMDLEVTSPSGIVYLGNAINTSTGLSVPGGSADNINSTEMVIVAAPEIGVWRVRTRATTVNMPSANPRQGYALVVTGAVQHP